MEGRGSCARDEQKLLFVIYTHCYMYKLLFNADYTVLKVAQGASASNPRYLCFYTSVSR
jgi:hypothetical protein